jgi:uncharacterized protein (DUF433 family)
LPGVHALLERIAIDARIHGGLPRVRGSRVRIRLNCRRLADDTDEIDLRAECPTGAREDTRAAIACGVEISQGHIVPVQSFAWQ